MKKESIKSHLKAYSIFQKRQTTINHAFASAIAPNDEYNDDVVSGAIKFLGQSPDNNLFCVYCGEPAETWDHVFGLVKNLKFSGYGHVIGNLLPSCKKCNSEKGNKNWSDFLIKKIKDEKLRKERSIKIQNYLNKYLPRELNYDKITKICPQEIDDHEKIKIQVLDLMKAADIIAASIRNKIKNYEK